MGHYQFGEPHGEVKNRESAVRAGVDYLRASTALEEGLGSYKDYMRKSDDFLLAVRGADSETKGLVLAEARKALENTDTKIVSEPTYIN